MPQNMDENDNLKPEITRLNRIITVLLDEISALKAQNSALRNEKGIENSNDTVPDYDKGIENNINTVTTSWKGTQSDIDTVPTSDKGIKNDNDTVATSWKGINTNIDTDVTIGKGIKSDFNTVAETGSTVKTGMGNAAVNLPTHIEVNSANLTKLAQVLRQYYPATKQRDAINIIARELLLLHNTSRATAKELRREAGLSKPGFAKHLPKLRRRGLIVKEPPLKYRLSEMSLGIIEKVFG